VKRVFFYVQHLLGIGHLRRAAVLARALSQRFDVLLVSGGAPVAGLEIGGARFHQLPPVRARDEGLRDLARLDGTPLDDAFRAARAQELVALLRTEAPEFLITEQFPFGRTQLRFELLPLLDAAKALPRPPRIFASVRDVLRDTARPERIAETVDTFDRFFDGVLVHADPALVGLDKSFAAWDRIAPRAHYTGYVAEHDAPAVPLGAGEVLVSAGGGAVGGPLLRAAIAARPLTSLADRTWRLLVGDNLPAADRRALAAGPGLVVEPARPDFTALLAGSVLSISQAGYNTVVETLLQADRAVLVPFATERETEQRQRATLLAARGMVQLVAADGVDGTTLAAAVERALQGPSIRSFARCKADGAPATTAFLAGLS
jgi:predicted glycosyltransferase